MFCVHIVYLWNTRTGIIFFITLLWVLLLSCCCVYGCMFGSVFVWQCVPEMAASSVACLCWHLHVKSCTSHADLAYDYCQSVCLSKDFYLYTFGHAWWLKHFICMNVHSDTVLTGKLGIKKSQVPRGRDWLTVCMFLDRKRMSLRLIFW